MTNQAKLDKIVDYICNDIESGKREWKERVGLHVVTNETKFEGIWGMADHTDLGWEEDMFIGCKYASEGKVWYIEFKIFQQEHRSIYITKDIYKRIYTAYEKYKQLKREEAKQKRQKETEESINAFIENILETNNQ